MQIPAKILEEFDKLKEQFVTKYKKPKISWSKCTGSITSKIFSHYIKKYSKGKFDISNENAFIEGFPKEWDLLIVKKGRKPYKFTAIYKPEDVICCMEFKTSGLRKNDEQLKEYAKKIKKEHGLLRKKNKSIKIIYLTMKVSDEYFEKTEKNFNPIPCFRLGRNERTAEVCENEDVWKELIAEIVSPSKS